jgi:hypothetical protein
MDLRTIARATGGTVQGRQVLCPGPGHSRTDNSLSIRLSSQSPTGYIVYSHCDDDFRVARDYVAAKLGLDLDGWRTKGLGAARQAPIMTPRKPAPEPDDDARIARARAVWDGAGPVAGSVAEAYLSGRGLSLDLLDNVQEVIRFHPRAPWRDEARAETIFVPCMVSAMRLIADDTITAIHRTRLGPDGTKLGRRMLGIARAAAIKLDGDDTVSHGLAIGEGVESCMAARALGFTPVWAMASAGAVASFPVLGGVEALTLLAENDPASDRAIGQCAERWHGAGREVTVVTPNFGSDLADVLEGAP